MADEAPEGTLRGHPIPPALMTECTHTSTSGIERGLMTLCGVPGLGRTWIWPNPVRHGTGAIIVGGRVYTVEYKYGKEVRAKSPPHLGLQDRISDRPRHGR